MTRRHVALPELVILIFLLPGVLWALGAPGLEWLDTPSRAGSQALVNTGYLLVLCGLASILCTPVGILWGALRRPWRSKTLHIMWCVFGVVSAIGVCLLILRYASPFFRG